VLFAEIGDEALRYLLVTRRCVDGSFLLGLLKPQD